jgi:hypothetical protein
VPNGTGLLLASGAVVRADVLLRVVDVDMADRLKSQGMCYVEGV